MDKELFKRILSSITLIPVVLFFIIKGSLMFILLITLCFLIVVYEWNNLSKKKSYNILGIIFILFSFYTVYRIRNDFNTDYFYFLFIISICIATDIGGYVFGKIIGGKKLSKISPNKTIAGTIGSFILSIIPLVIALNFNFLDLEFNLTNIIFCLLISLISQIGDLFISLIKRKAEIKDTGNLLPGHGGILDRMDGIIFAVPFSYFLLKLI